MTFVNLKSVPRASCLKRVLWKSISSILALKAILAAHDSQQCVCILDGRISFLLCLFMCLDSVFMTCTTSCMSEGVVDCLLGVKMGGSYVWRLACNDCTISTECFLLLASLYTPRTNTICITLQTDFLRIWCLSSKINHAYGGLSCLVTAIARWNMS